MDQWIQNLLVGRWKALEPLNETLYITIDQILVELVYFRNKENKRRHENLGAQNMEEC